jgi:serine/threonine protein kinase
LYDVIHILNFLKKELGRGTFGVVWLYEDSANGKEYAIKETSITPQIDKEITERELVIAKRIGSEHNCPGLVRIYDCFEEDEKYYVVMEYCKRGSLLNFMKEKGNFQNEKVFHIYSFLEL